jgi:hypothetical protein
MTTFSISGRASLDAAVAKLKLIPAVVHDETDRVMAEILADLVANAPEQTPWRKKPKGHESDPHMQDVYSQRIIVTAGTIGQLLNQRFYAGWVGRTGTPRSKPNARLKSWLEHQDAEIDVLMTQAINRRVTALMR